MNSQSSQSTVSFRSLKTDAFAKHIDPNMTEKEISEQYDKMVMLSVRKATAAKENIIWKALKKAKKKNRPAAPSSTTQEEEVKDDTTHLQNT